MLEAKDLQLKAWNLCNFYLFFAFLYLHFHLHMPLDLHLLFGGWMHAWMGGCMDAQIHGWMGG